MNSWVVKGIHNSFYETETAVIRKTFTPTAFTYHLSYCNMCFRVFSPTHMPVNLLNIFIEPLLNRLVPIFSIVLVALKNTPYFKSSL